MHSWSRNLLIGSVFGALMMSYLFGLIPVYGDGIGYHFLYQQLRVGNWSLTSQFDPPPTVEDYMYMPARGGWSTYYQIGAPLTWALAVPLIPAPSSLLNRFAARRLELPFTSSFLWDGLFILTLTSFLAAATLWLTARFTIRSLGVSPTAAWAGATAAFFGLPTWYYSFYGASYSHIVELFIVVSAFIAWWTAHQRASYPLLALSSALFGYAALVRIDAWLFLVPLGITSLMRFRSPWRTCLAWAPTLLVFSLQLMIWQHLFGALLPSQKYTLGEFQAPARNVFDVLFSGTRGLFVWSPIAAVGVAGLIGVLKKSRFRLFATIGVSMLVLYTLFYGSWRVWWGGDAFGQRFLIPLYPFLAVGIAFSLQALRGFPRWIRGLSHMLITLALLYAIFLSVVYPHVGRAQPDKEFHTPWQTFLLFNQEHRPSPRLFFLRLFWHGPRVIHLFLT